MSDSSHPAKSSQNRSTRSPPRRRVFKRRMTMRFLVDRRDPSSAGRLQRCTAQVSAWPVHTHDGDHLAACLGTGSAVSKPAFPLALLKSHPPASVRRPRNGHHRNAERRHAMLDLGTSPSSMFGSTASFDGGGMAAGSARLPPRRTRNVDLVGMSATSGMSTTSGMWKHRHVGMCGSGSSSIASSSTPTVNARPQRRVVALEPEFRWDPRDWQSWS